MRKALVIGRAGQAAQALARRADAAPFTFVFLGRPELDLEDAARADSLVRQEKPALVINAAAYTQVDQAEAERARAHAVNAAGAGAIAHACAAVGAPLIHLSTDFVFDGEKGAPYVESDAPNPLNAYGASKLAGEKAVAESGARAAIVRTAWVYGPGGAGFAAGILKAAQTRDVVEVVSDQIGSPTFTGDLAAALITLGERLCDGAEGGLVHLAGAGGASRAAFAEALIEAAGARARVEPVLSARFPAQARRPRDTRLDCSLAAARYGIALRPWCEAVGDYVAARSAR